MKVKEFARQAIKNGYDNSRCEGWDWIKANLAELDHIFQLPEYKAQKGMKYLCTPFIYGKEELTELEKHALDTAWYLNNDREHLRIKEEHKQKMLAEGWLELTPDIVKEAFSKKNKLEIIAKISCDWLTQGIKEIYKPFIDNNGDCFLMKPKARSRGISIHRLENAFCKII